MQGLKIDSLYGNCPVQAEGTIDDCPFYFRARGDGWSFEVAEPKGDPVGDADWRIWVRYEPPQGAGHPNPEGDRRFAAGWMDETEARAFIERAAGWWRHREDLGDEAFLGVITGEEPPR